MKVSLTPVNNNYSFQAKRVSKKETPTQPTKREITDAKIKQSVSECFWVVLGAGTLYFFTKIKYNTNKINIEKENLKKLTKKTLKPILPSAIHIEKARRTSLIKN